VELTDRGESTRVGVTDNGPGIPAQQRERVFNRFIRLSDESAGGTGLGLAICRKIAELHHAEITLASGPNDVGLCVCVDFPKVQPTLTA
jgi:signal transduction histidine kinase